MILFSKSQSSSNLFVISEERTENHHQKSARGSSAFPLNRKAALSESDCSSQSLWESISRASHTAPGTEKSSVVAEVISIMGWVTINLTLMNQKLTNTWVVLGLSSDT